MSDLLDRLAGLFAPPKLVEEFSQLNPGKVHVKGIVRAGEDVLRSPVKGVPCVAFFYRAVQAVQGRGAVVDRVIKSAEVYSPLFYLEMKGGSLRVMAKKTGSFDTQEHRDLQNSALQGIQTSEQAIQVKEHVSLEGRLKMDDEGLYLVPSVIHLVKPETKKLATRRRPAKKAKQKG